MEVARVERFRNDRVARYFAEEHGGEYMGWVENPTVFTVKRNDEAITKTDDGAYIVIWKEENNGGMVLVGKKIKSRKMEFPDEL